jgi:hypothetical protein
VTQKKGSSLRLKVGVTASGRQLVAASGCHWALRLALRQVHFWAKIFFWQKKLEKKNGQH